MSEELIQAIEQVRRIIKERSILLDAAVLPRIPHAITYTPRWAGDSLMGLVPLPPSKPAIPDNEPRRVHKPFPARGLRTAWEPEA